MKTGFTLAEVLITLGIIGIVAAMTLPALINNHKHKELQTALNKEYSVIQQALLLMQANDGNVITAENWSSQSFKREFMKYFKVIKDCGTGCNPADCVYNTGFDAEKIRQENYKSYNKRTEIWSGFLDDGQFITADGAMYFIENTASSNKIFISVDVNGYKKRPNLWGHDLFTFELMSNGKILPMGANATSFTDENTYCSKNSSSRENGISCAYKALTDKNYWKNLPK